MSVAVKARSEARTQSSRARSTLHRKEAIAGYLFISPWLIGFFVFLAFPLGYSFYISLTDYSGLGATNWVGLDNYQHILSGADPLVTKSVWNTVWYVLIVVPLTIVLGLALALLLHRPVPGISFFRTLFYLPNVVPIVASVAVLSWLFHGQYGLINAGLEKLGISGPGWLTDPRWVKWVIIGWALWTVGATTVVFLAGLQAIPEDLYEAAQLDGAGRMARLWHVTLPMLSSIMFFNVIIAVINTFQVFVPALLLGGTGQFSSAGGPSDSLLFYVLYIYQNGFVFYKMGYAAAMSWLLFVAILVLTLGLFKIGNRLVYYETS